MNGLIACALIALCGCERIGGGVIEERYRDGSFDVPSVDIVRDGVRYKCSAPWKLGRVRCVPVDTQAEAPR